LRFEPIYYRDGLRLINPYGDVGVITFWSGVEKVVEHLASTASDVLDPEHSRVVAIANLYGDGMYAMFCNLLNNPQVRHLVGVGIERGLPTRQELEAFLAQGLEDAVMLGTRMKRIVGTDRLLPSHPAFDDARLRATLTFQYIGRLHAGLGPALRNHLAALPPPPADHPARVHVEIKTAVRDDYSYRPSDVTAHQIVRRRPLQCWKELVVRVIRFGPPVALGSEQRLELLNVKAVITEPEDEPAEWLAEYGFSLDAFRRYQEVMLRPDPPEGGVAYSYGHRLRGYFPQPDGGTDALQTVIDRLRKNPGSRGGHISLWDSSTDLGLPDGESPRESPCLTSVTFRQSGEDLTMAATYRAHNLLRAWLENVYGLMAVQRYVAERTGMGVGALTVISNSLGINPAATEYERARALADQWVNDGDFDEASRKYTLRHDPNGTFVVFVDTDDDEIIAEHWAQGVLQKRYGNRRADMISREVAADMALTLPSHALWLGAELARAEAKLRHRTTGSPTDADDD